MRTLPVSGYEGLYSVREDGKIYTHRIRSGRHSYRSDPNSFIEMKQTLKSRGYYGITCYDENSKVKYISVHRIVCTAFHPNPMFLGHINHIDGDKLNNKASNLEWCTQKYNARHAIAIGLCSYIGENNPASKLSDLQRLEIYYKYTRDKISQRVLSKSYNVHLNTIWKTVRKMRIKYE